MKLKKLLGKLERFLATDRDVLVSKRKFVHDLLKKLKEKERSLREQLDLCRDEDERERLKTRLEVAHAQRKKGVERIKALKKKRSD